MAIHEFNIKEQVKNADGDYDILYPQSKSSNIIMDTLAGNPMLAAALGVANGIATLNADGKLNQPSGVDKNILLSNRTMLASGTDMDNLLTPGSYYYPYALNTLVNGPEKAPTLIVFPSDEVNTLIDVYVQDVGNGVTKFVQEITCDSVVIKRSWLTTDIYKPSWKEFLDYYHTSRNFSTIPNFSYKDVSSTSAAGGLSGTIYKAYITTKGMGTMGGVLEVFSGWGQSANTNSLITSNFFNTSYQNPPLFLYSCANGSTNTSLYSISKSGFSVAIGAEGASVRFSYLAFGITD